MTCACDLPGTEALDAQTSFNRRSAWQKRLQKNPLSHWYQSPNMPCLIILGLGWQVCKRTGDEQ